MNLHDLSELEIILTLCEMLIVVPLLAYTFFLTWRDKRYLFFGLLCAILIIVDISQGFISVFSIFEITNNKNNAFYIAIVMGISVSLTFSGLNVVHWLLGWKYWVISR